jgi:uncharacterized protein (TIGR03083 family)
VVDQLAQVWTSVTEACERLDTRQWELDTDCPGWGVKDQLSHLVGVERMLLGDPAPPALTERPAHVNNDFGALNESWIEARRAVPGDQVLDEFGEVSHRRLRALAAMGRADFDQVGWSPVGEVPYRQFMETRVVDSWAHEQDIRRAVGRPGGRDGAGEAIVLDRCAQTMPYVIGKRVAPPEGSRVLFVVTGALGRRISVTVTGGRAALYDPPPDDKPTVTLGMEQETFWRLGFGRVTAADALAGGQVRVEGDAQVGRRVLESMAFMT